MLVTLADAKIYLGIDPNNTQWDVFLTDQLTMVSDVVEAYCRRNFASADYVQTFYRGDYAPNRQIELYQFPLNTVASITEDGVAVDPSLYRLHKPTGKIFYSSQTSAFFCGAEETVVTYNAGFDTIPTPVVGAIMSIIQERYNKKSSGVDLNFGSDVQRISIPGAISIDFDYSLQNNLRSAAFGSVIGSQANILDYYRSERAILGAGKLSYVE